MTSPDAVIRHFTVPAINPRSRAGRSLPCPPPAPGEALLAVETFFVHRQQRDLRDVRRAHALLGFLPHRRRGLRQHPGVGLCAGGGLGGGGYAGGCALLWLLPDVDPSAREA